MEKDALEFQRLENLFHDHDSWLNNLLQRNIPVLKVSCVTGDGIPLLVETLHSFINKWFEGVHFQGDEGETAIELLITRERHRHCLKEALAALERFSKYFYKYSCKSSLNTRRLS